MNVISLIFKQLFSSNQKLKNLPPQAAGDSFNAGSTNSSGDTYKNIITAKVISVEKHPNADRLRIVHLSNGKNDIGPLVCGAFNFEAGDMVALALPGANIPKNIHSEAHEPFTLGKAKIRGIESQGMICAAFELGIGPLSDKPEIMILKQSIAPGSQFSPEMIKDIK